MSDHSFIPKANPKIVPPAIPAPRKESLEQEIASLQAEVERLKGIILAQSSDFVRNAVRQEEEIKPDGWNTAVSKAVDLLMERDNEINRLKAEVKALKLGSLLTAVDVMAFIKLKEENSELNAEVQRLNEAIVRGAIIPDAKPE